MRPPWWWLQCVNKKVAKVASDMLMMLCDHTDRLLDYHPHMPKKITEVGHHIGHGIRHGVEDAVKMLQKQVEDTLKKLDLGSGGSFSFLLLPLGVATFIIVITSVTCYLHDSIPRLVRCCLIERWT